MGRHRFDPVSAVLGIVAVVGGAFVALGAAGDVDPDVTAWTAAAALLAGVAIIPWRRRQPVDDGSGLAGDDVLDDGRSGG